MDDIEYKVRNISSDLNIGKSIKSKYNLKEILLFLGRKRLYNLIIYNKHLQKELEINLEEYKKISGKYKIGEKNGIGRVYKLDTNILIFKGEYTKGKKNGKGIEYYDNDKLKFEGEYLKGEKNGKGKEYYFHHFHYYGNYNSKLKFDGEYLKGKRWNGKGYNINGNIDFIINNGNGEGKEYNQYGQLEFLGEYLNGERNGNGKEYDQYGQLEYEGEYLNGERNGKGKEYE